MLIPYLNKAVVKAENQRQEEWETEGTVGLQTKPSKEKKKAKQMRPELCCSEFGKNFSMTWVEGNCKIFIGL